MTTMLMATMMLAMGSSHAPKAPKATTVTRVEQAFKDAEENLDVRRSQLGLLGSAPFLGERPEPRPARMQAFDEKANTDVRTASRP